MCVHEAILDFAAGRVLPGTNLIQQADQVIVPFGAGSVLASDLIAKSEPDGYSLLLMSNASAVSAGLFKSLPCNKVKDFTPILTPGFFDVALMTSEESRFKTLERCDTASQDSKTVVESMFGIVTESSMFNE